MAGRGAPQQASSSASTSGNRAGPSPAVRQLAEYCRLLTPSLPLFYGELDTLILDDWEMLVVAAMDAHEVPARFRVPIAALQLRGPALMYWESRRRQIGSSPPWSEFYETMRGRFRRDGQLTRWRYDLSQFRQRPGEGIRAYGQRFDAHVVATCPYGPGPMGDLFQMVVYSRGLQPYFRIPQPPMGFANMAEMRAAHEMYDDRAFLPFGLAPEVPAPAPEPVPAPAPAPAPAPEPVPVPAPGPVPDPEPVPVPAPEDQAVPEVDVPPVVPPPVGIIAPPDDDSDMEIDWDGDSDTDTSLFLEDSESDPSQDD